MEINNLNTSWTYWFHKYNDNKWDLESYTKLYKFDSVEEFAALQIILKPKHIQNGMFFLMRNDIEPMWESKDNIDGGCFSFKVYKQEIPETWKILTTKLVNERILKDKNNHMLINGMSISPKKTYSIIKLWLKGDTIKNIEELNDIPILKDSTPIYKKHK